MSTSDPNARHRLAGYLRALFLTTALLGMNPAELLAGDPMPVRSLELTENPANPIQRRVLDPTKVVRILVGEDRLTTIRFPAPIAGMESARASTDPHSESLFLVSFEPGEAFFSVRALVPDGATSLNVTWKKETYVFELIACANPWLAVNLEAPRSVVSTSRRPPWAPAQLLGRLDMAKALPLLQDQHPGELVGVERVRPNVTRDYGDYTIRTEEIVRFDADDVLVFRIAIQNTTPEPIRFLPASLMVRVGNLIFPQAITDASGELPPGAEVPVYFAIAGSADGSRADLSLRNDFFVLLTRLPSEPTSPQPTAAPPTAVVPEAPASPSKLPVATEAPPPPGSEKRPGWIRRLITAPRHPVPPPRHKESWPPRRSP
jgi:hypothetical protein